MLDWLLDGNARDEEGTPRNGFLSTTREIHAAGIGATFGLLMYLTGEPGVAMAFVAVLLGKAKVSSSHFRDAAKEAAYTGAFFAVTYGVATLLL